MNHVVIFASWSLPLLLSALCPSSTLPLSRRTLSSLLPGELISSPKICSKQQPWQASRWPPSLVVVPSWVLCCYYHTEPTGLFTDPKHSLLEFTTSASWSRTEPDSEGEVGHLIYVFGGCISANEAMRSQCTNLWKGSCSSATELTVLSAEPTLCYFLYFLPDALISLLTSRAGSETCF